jgi:glycosyltransferase involved in cell wall biosynthesis
MIEERPSSTPRPCLSVIVPCFNEEATVASLLERVADVPWVAEIIAVDDGSTDRTAEIITALNIEILSFHSMGVNQGKGAALREGFRLATSEFVIVQDADLEYDPAEYGIMLEPMLTGAADVVFGSRFVSGRPHRVLYFWHSMGNRMLTLASNAFTNLNLTDMETCYKLFRREIIQSIEIEENRFGIEPEVTAKVARGGWRVFEVGISYSGRTYAEGKKIGWRDAVRAFVCILKYSNTGTWIRSTFGRTAS